MKFSDLFSVFGGRKMNRSELAVLRVSMLVAALDGDVCPDELREFERLARECEGFAKEEVDRAFAETLRSAGYVMLLSRVAAREAVLDAFVEEAERILPMIVDFGRLGIDGAVEIWKKMANADGEFADVEREAIERLERLLNARLQAQVQTPVGTYQAVQAPVFR